ncbi:MAG: putative integral rane protein [Gaiellaceae bacterium]|nr:putative integral rane protein [Gaiellaceae bacterium]
MSLYDGLLFLHVLTAFALVAALVVFWIIGIVSRNVARPAESLRYFRVAQPANILIVVGTLGTLIFGIWLAVERDEYQVWDGWILAALVLWAVASEAGRRGGLPYMEAKKLAERLAAEGRADEPSPELHAKLKDRSGMMLNALSSLAVLLLLLDMIYKPGA